MPWLSVDRSKVLDLVGGGLATAVGLGLAAATASLPDYAGKAPGPGFFPHGLAAIMTVLGLLLVVGTLLRRPDSTTDPIEPPTVSVMRVVAVAAGLAGAVALIPFIGFMLSLVAMTVFLMVGVEGVGPWRAVVFACVLALAIYVVFAIGLEVPLPRGPLGF